MPEINDIDAEILRFIRAHEPTSLDSIISGLPNISAVSFRVKQMCSSGRYHTPGTRDRNDWFITQDTRTFRDGTVLKEEYLDAYRLTDLGKKVLQDHEYSEKKAPAGTLAEKRLDSDYCCICNHFINKLHAAEAAADNRMVEPYSFQNFFMTDPPLV
ncbi:hypothetical protein ACEVJL_09415 [Pseudoflavonifractor sp. P01025]|uniref:hypothetical protein n=1 Tax=Flintibacter porci TaxID=3342383 RepID=UPI0035B673CC